MSVSILRLPAVKQRTGLSRSTIYAKVASGEFPASVQLTERAVGWRSDEIDKWIADRTCVSREKSPPSKLTESGNQCTPDVLGQ